MIDKYVDGNKINRVMVALDIKNGRISKSELDSMLNEFDVRVRNGDIENPYIGDVYSGKRKKTEWNETYLDFLVAEMSSSEAFNRQNLVFLCEVAAYVHGATKRLLLKVLAVFVGLSATFFAGHIVANETNIRARETIQKEVFALQDEKSRLQKENEELRKKLEEEKSGYASQNDGHERLPDNSISSDTSIMENGTDLGGV